MPHVDVAGARLHYDVRGSGEPLLWLNGFVLSAAAWDPVLPLYTSTFECITFDNRLTGRSLSRPGLVSIPQLAGDAVALLDALRIDSAHVYGLSYGGMVAQELAIRFPHRVRGLVLGATTPGGPHAVLPAFGALAAASAHGLPGMVFSRKFVEADPARARRLARQMRRHRAPGLGVAAHLLASTYHDTTSRLGQIQAPTLVLHGDADVMTPLANARLLAARIPDAQLAVVPDAGHAYLLEQPETSAQLLREWFARRGPISAAAARPSYVEPVTRRFGLATGVLRTGASLATLPAAMHRRRRMRSG